MSKSLCPLPWLHQCITTNGDIFTCVHTKAAKKGGLKKKDGSVYNAKGDSLQESRNSDTLKAIRLKMLKGEAPEECIRCHTEEKHKVLSRRQWELLDWKEDFNYEKAKKLTAVDGSISVKESPVLSLEVRQGNHCNLKCRMCHPSASSFWYEDHVQLYNQTKFKDGSQTIELKKTQNNSYKPKDGNYSWINKPRFWSQVKEISSSIKYVQAVGGEPLLIQEHYEFLNYVIKTKQSQKIILDYNTNLTFLPSKAFKLWENFKTVKVFVSIDAHGKLNDYIRHPSRFEKIEEHLNKLLYPSLNNLEVAITTTISVYNVLHMPELISWFLQRKQNLKMCNISFHPVYNPQQLNIKILPKIYKQKVERKWMAFLSGLKDTLKEYNYSELEIKDTYRHYSMHLKGYVEFMKSEDLSELVPEFLNYSLKLDKIRGESMEEVLPELYQVCKNHTLQA